LVGQNFTLYTSLTGKTQLKTPTDLPIYTQREEFTHTDTGTHQREKVRIRITFPGKTSGKLCFSVNTKQKDGCGKVIAVFAWTD
jgi:hypothetical protein